MDSGKPLNFETHQIDGKVLIVDDHLSIRSLLAEMLRREGIQTLEAASAEEALLFIEDPQIFLCYTDIVMPGLNGTELLKRIKPLRPDMAVILVSGCSDTGMAENALHEGAFFYLNKPFHRETILLLARRAWEAKELRRAYRNLENSILQDQVLSTMSSLAAAIDAKSNFTREHSERVACFSRRLARAMGLDKEGVDRVFAGALLHDVGKVGVPDSILNKPDSLTHEEKLLVQKHPTIGKEILSPISATAPFLDIVEYHHENWDGTGYPNGLKGDEIPLEAQIVQVADTFDAITSTRPYRTGSLTDNSFQDILEQGSGTQFSPKVVSCFLALLLNEDPIAT